ncbi:MAG: hypothetical protein ACRCST_05215 [Turicibacter sp.]
MKLSCEGILGYIRAAIYSFKHTITPIKLNGNIENTDEFIVVTPLWAGGIASKIRSFLKTVSNDKVHFVVTSKSSQLQDDLGYKSLTHNIRSQKNEGEVINSFINQV